MTKENRRPLDMTKGELAEAYCRHEQRIIELEADYAAVLPLIDAANEWERSDPIPTTTINKALTRAVCECRVYRAQKQRIAELEAKVKQLEGERDRAQETDGHTA